MVQSLHVTAVAMGFGTNITILKGAALFWKRPIPIY